MDAGLKNAARFRVLEARDVSERERGSRNQGGWTMKPAWIQIRARVYETPPDSDHPSMSASRLSTLSFFHPKAGIRKPERIEDALAKLRTTSDAGLGMWRETLFGIIAEAFDCAPSELEGKELPLRHDVAPNTALVCTEAVAGLDREAGAPPHAIDLILRPALGWLGDFVPIRYIAENPQTLSLDADPSLHFSVPEVIASLDPLIDRAHVFERIERVDVTMSQKFGFTRCPNHRLYPSYQTFSSQLKADEMSRNWTIAALSGRQHDTSGVWIVRLVLRSPEGNLTIDAAGHDPDRFRRWADLVRSQGVPRATGMELQERLERYGMFIVVRQNLGVPASFSGLAKSMADSMNEVGKASGLAAAQLAQFSKSVAQMGALSQPIQASGYVVTAQQWNAAVNALADGMFGITPKASPTPKAPTPKAPPQITGLSPEELRVIAEMRAKAAGAAEEPKRGARMIELDDDEEPKS